jgi:DNA polymerase III subunit alpha
MKGTSLRTKSHYSCGLAIGTAEQYITTATNKNIGSIVISDYCSMGGVLDFYNEAKKNNFKVAIGVEFTLDSGHYKNSIPIVLISKNQNGYMNLCKLTTSAHL